MLDFLIQNWVLVLAALTSGAMLLAPQFLRRGGSLAVPVNEAVRLINREKGVLVDVSDAAEFAAGHAKGARHVPLAELSKSPLPAGANALPTNKALPVLLICPRGRRSATAAALLRKAGFERALSVEGGLAAWREAQLPVEKSAEPVAAKA